jgi:hypothetical protein
MQKIKQAIKMKKLIQNLHSSQLLMHGCTIHAEKKLRKKLKYAVLAHFLRFNWVL